MLRRLGGAQLVAQLDHLGRLDEQRGARRRLVVHDPADVAAGGAADRDHVAAAADGDGGIGGALGGVEPAQQTLELLDESLARFAHLGAGARQLLRRAVEHPAVWADRVAEARLQLLGWRIDAQCRRARRALGEPLQVPRGDARRGERHGQMGERLPLERASRDAEQLEGGTDIGDGLGTNAVIVEQQRGELGDLREGAADGGGVSRGGAAHHARRAEGSCGMRRHPRQRGGELECVQTRG